VNERSSQEAARRLPAIAGLLAVGWSAGIARTGRVPPGEARVFRAVNGAPDALHPLLWPVMQAGSLGAVYATAATIGRRRGPAAAGLVAGVGTAVWGGVKLVKPAVGRGRPAAHLPEVHVRGAEQSGLGYPSGHAAVALTLALIGTRPGRWRTAGLAVAALTGTARVYVGAHLPLDVAGGYGIGLLAATATRVTGKLA
jgi:membrane-associated phospholipid phosphatase